jgi:FMN reductase
VYDLVTICGSPAASSPCAFLVRETLLQARARKFACEAVEVRELPAGPLLRGEPSEELDQAFERLSHARAVVIASPVFRASFAGALKLFLDRLPSNALAGKHILPLATLISPVHAGTYDRALRPVLTALGAVFVLETVFILEDELHRRDNGYLVGDAADARLGRALAELFMLAGAR